MRRSNRLRRDTCVRNAGCALAALALVSCIAACEGAVGTGESTDDPDEYWRAVRAYVETDAVWHATALSDKGPHPDITLAVAAARAIVDDEAHPRRGDAAEFLIDHPSGVSSTASADIALGIETLVAHVGADWDAVGAYQERREAWRQRGQALGQGEVSVEESRELRKAWLADEPKILRAMAAAAAVAATDGHQARREAAEFLVQNASRLLAGRQFAFQGADVLLNHFPDYDGWPGALAALDSPIPDGRSDELWERIAADAVDPAVRATARYYLASRLARAANEFSASLAERKARQARALATATGLSVGVEQEELHAQTRRAEDGTLVGATFAQAETELIYRIKHATAGGMLPEAGGKRLDGGEESLADYAGKVLLIDFWATWCSPCIRALPKLRELVATLPPERFALLGISSDDELSTVTEFQQDEPMPWPNWHIGTSSELTRVWDVRAYPTYILVDGEGVILARVNELSAPFVTLIEASVATLAGDDAGAPTT